MHRILYISTARAPISTSDLNLLLASARRKNAASDITGLLIVGGRRFLQVLEGPEDAVSRTYGRIAQDPRHFALVKLNDRPIEERSFGQWAMGFEEGGETPTTGNLDAQVSALVAPLADATLRAYLLGFARSHTSS